MLDARHDHLAASAISRFPPLAFASTFGVWRGTSTGVALSQIAITAMGYADLVLVKHLFGPTEAGMYGAVSLCGKTMYLASNFLPTIVLPKATARAMRGETTFPLLVQAGAAGLAIVGVGVGLSAIAPVLVLRLFSGARYLSAAPLLLPYMAAMAMLGLANVAATYKTGLHRFGFAFPLFLTALAEIVAISRWHQSLSQIVLLLLGGHTVAFVVAIHGITRPVSAARSLSVVEAA